MGDSGAAGGRLVSENSHLKGGVKLLPVLAKSSTQ